ncbi:U3 small nucleolar RNA-associated protein 14 [Ananas comosus]|uniref:U3 small nucleolar RNA-associated protein 14 n=1 Tax=Ananas comosus TaxID=4615 RepID=A0A199VUU1_ANACO|nr:U3 small nucleolar RNA-associated protein 14 [Ananas comosus]
MDDDYAGGDRGEDVYEYDEPVPEEEARKNRRFDEVENYEYELPEDFEDEDVPSDEGEEDEEITSNRSDDDGEEGEKHLRMLQEVTGMPAEAFDDKKKKKKVTLSDFQGDDGDQRISIHDLLDSIRGKTGYSELRKRVEQQESKPMAVQVPLPKVEREKLERKFAYEHAKKDITKWEPLVKRNREAPTLLFEQDVDLGFSTVGAIASQFEPRTEFERKMAKLVRDPEMVEAYNKDGARLLELNEVSVEDVKERQNRLAKMRSLLFRHEMKAKHIKKIKSKTYHRILKKEKLKAASAELQVDPEVAKEYAMKQEFKRAEERMTLKHKNSSKWAKRILQRGLNVQDEGTRAAIAEQLHQHALLTRKMNSMKDDTSSSDESTDNEDLDEELSPGKDDERVSKLLNRAKDKTVKVLEEEDEIPKSGVLALPFMERGLKKRQEAAYEEARLALQEYDASLRQFEDGDVEESQRSLKIKGKRAFGPKNQPQESNKRTKLDDVERSSDSEDEYEAAEQARVGSEVNNKSDEVHLGTALLDDEPETAQGAVFKSMDDIFNNPGPKTTYEVALFTDNSWKKMKSKGVSGNNTESTAAKDPPKPNNDMKEMDENDDSDSEEEMVEGFLSTSDGKANYELPSQAVLIHQAFAGDDVEAEFEKDKMEALNEEVPEPEKPVLLPGWGQWTHIQQKKGLPSWMIKEHENAERKREEALKKRKDAKLKHVIISENIDKKAEKLLATTLPFPYKSKEVYEQSIRMPIGPEFNPAISVQALNRPALINNLRFMENKHEQRENASSKSLPGRDYVLLNYFLVEGSR